MPDEELDIRQPFTLGDGLRAGLTDSQLRSRGFVRLFRGCFVSAAASLTPDLLARAALRAAPVASFAARHTAARILGGTVPHDAETHVGTVGTGRSRKPGILVHRYTDRPELVRRKGVRLTSPVRTFLDLAEVLSLVDLVVLGDSLVKRRQVEPGQLVLAASEWRGRGARRARQAAALVRPGVDSPQETRTRLLLVFAGLPEPEVNIEIRDEYGAVQRRIDLGYRRAKLGIEYDGRQHIERQRAWGADILRREDLGNVGWRFVVLVSDDLFTSPGETLTRVVRAMRSVGMTVPVLRDDWRRHFPGRPG
jgi:hypothetical protein